MKNNRFLELSIFTPDDWSPRDTSEVISWHGHMPFAFSLIKTLKPQCFVELGTHKGDSYFAFCEAVARYSVQTRCFAVDTWKGDEHSGYYDEGVFEEFHKLHDQHYKRFSSIIRSTFDDARLRFSDGSIDLLHIDGLHSYDAVRHDFETWKSKMSDQGVILLHDIDVHYADFGVWKLWDELCAIYPSFAFHHSNGLGVLAVGRKAKSLLPDLFEITQEDADRIRILYSTLGDSIAFRGLYKLLLMEREKSFLEQAELKKRLAESDNKLASLDEELTKEKDQIAETLRLLELSERGEDGLYKELLTEREAYALKLASLNQGLAEKEGQLTAVLNSRSWRITAPLRRFFTVIRFARQEPKMFMVALFRKIYRDLPVSIAMRHKFKETAYRHFPEIFSGTWSYQLWRTHLCDTESSRLSAEEPSVVGGSFEFACQDNPMVSIIIPVFGKVEYTYQCLRSLWSHRSRYSFEVIVVDDCSPDNTMAVLKNIKGLILIGNESNLGFIRSCNRGAQQARGKLLVMLNNDTIVRSGWLDELVNTFNCTPQAGLVGSKLIYANGMLQEAGGIIWQDGSGWNYGRLQDPCKPEYNYLRDVDYCSGASLMISKELFDRLGGFDEHYLPAYGEDSDLAFRVRQAGYRVLYQPLSEVIHFEGVTSGKDVSAGAKSYQVENTTKFLDRWKTVLAGHGKPGVHPEREKDRGISGRALVIDHCTPTPDQDAGSITAINLMRILQGLGFKVTFIPEDNFLCMNPYTKDLQRIGIECLYAPHVKSLEQHLAKHGEQYDVVVVFRLLAAERHLGAVRKYCPNAKLVFHTSDLHYLREMREAELVGSDTLHKKARKTQERELRIIRAVDATIVHSLAEKHMLDTILKSEDSGRSNVHLFGWAIEIPGTQVPFEQRNGMAFVGGFQHPPNIDAVLWFAKDIFPIIRQELPDALLYIVGSRATQEILRLEGDGIKVVGYMEDLRPLLDRCRMSVVPIRYGAGIKGKIGTSLSYGLPCVSTTIGAEGMGLKEGDGVLVADDPADFAATVIRLHNDQALWNSCSQGGLDFVRRNYSLEAGIKTIHDVLKGTGLPENKMSESSIPEFLGSMNHETTKYQADQIDDPLEVVRKIQTVIEYNDWSHSPEYKICREKERDIISKHAAENIYNLPGYCKICEREVDFLIDRQCGAVQTGTGWMPNWRERMVCPMCGLNNRQRMIAVAARDKAMRYRDRMPSIYLMEQVTNIYKWFKNRLPQAHCVGSEYLGEKYCSGQIIKGIRHEDVEHLSFEDSSFDLVVSNDVLEHVENYRQALNELCRVIRPRGELLMTVPFHLDRENNEKRAEIVHGRLNHILPPLYHGNPVSDKGSLVFTDFGWEFLQDIRNAGFKKTTLHFYWSEVYGHLGAGQHYICATKE